MKSLDQIIRLSPGLSPVSKRHYASVAKSFEAFADGRRLTPELVDEWRDDLVRHRRMQTASVVGYLNVIRFVAARHPQGDFARGVKNPSRIRNQSALTLVECQRLLATTQGQGTRERRDRALIALMLGAALKPSEAVSLHVRDLQMDPARVLDMWLGPVTVALIKPWADIAPGPALFPGLTGRGGDTRASALSMEGVSRTLSSRARVARVFRFTPKRLRYTFMKLADACDWNYDDAEAVLKREPRREHLGAIDVIASVISWQDAVRLDHTS